MNCNLVVGDKKLINFFLLFLNTEMDYNLYYCFTKLFYYRLKSQGCFSNSVKVFLMNLGNDPMPKQFEQAKLKISQNISFN